MKHSIRLFLKFLCRGIAWGCTFFVFYSIILYLLQPQSFLNEMLSDYAGQAIGAILVGIGYGTTPVIYLRERPSLLAKTCIHFLVGTSVLFVVGLHLHWFPAATGSDIALAILIACGSFAVFWIIFHALGRTEAKQINTRLQEIQSASDENDDTAG